MTIADFESRAAFDAWEAKWRHVTSGLGWLSLVPLAVSVVVTFAGMGSHVWLALLAVHAMTRAAQIAAVAYVDRRMDAVLDALARDIERMDAEIGRRTEPRQ